MEEQNTHTSYPSPNQIEELEMTQPTEAEEQPQEAAATGQHNPYAVAVWTALVQHKVSSKCNECRRAEGWKDWELIQIPSAIPTYQQNTIIPVAMLICRRCAHTRFYSLGTLGLQITQEERRIVTPDGQQQPPQPIIAGV